MDRRDLLSAWEPGLPVWSLWAAAPPVRTTNTSMTSTSRPSASAPGLQPGGPPLPQRTEEGRSACRAPRQVARGGDGLPGVLRLTATLMARSSPYAKYAHRACADACRDCAAACEGQQDEIMKECVKACRDCEKVCRQMAGGTD